MSLVQHHTLKATVEVWLHALFNPALHERKWTASHNACSLNKEKATDTDLTSGWLKPITYLVALGKKNKFYHCKDSNLYFSIFQPVAYSLYQCFSTFVRPRPGKFFFHKPKARSQQIYSSVLFQISLSSYIK